MRTKKEKDELATLLEGAGCVLNIPNISKRSFIHLWWKYAVKLDNCYNEVNISGQRTYGGYRITQFAKTPTGRAEVVLI